MPKKVPPSGVPIQRYPALSAVLAKKRVRDEDEGAYVLMLEGLSHTLGHRATAAEQHAARIGWMAGLVHARATHRRADAPVHDALVKLVATFTSGAWCTNCGETAGTCGCIVDTCRRALAKGGA